MNCISVIICCYNSASRLPETLKYLALQKLSNSLEAEVILVDNASTDSTQEVAIKEWNKYKSTIQFRIIEEKIPGLIHARNAGVKDAKHEIIIFCDDDNWLHEDYLNTAHTIMNENPSIGALGGEGIGILESEKPEWFDDFQTGYAIGKQAAINGDISERGYIYGAGLVSRKEILKKVFCDNFPFLLLGRKENVLLAGDDSEICKRILLLGYQLHFNDKLIYNHYIPKNRLTWSYKKKMFEGFDLSSPILSKYDEIISLSKRGTFNLIKSTSIFILKWIYATISQNKKNHFSCEIRKNICMLFSSTRFLNEMNTKQIVNFYLKQKKHHNHN